MTYPLVILLGVSHSGKDTLYNALKNSPQGDQFVKVSFPSPLKRFLETQYNLPENTLDTPEGKALPMGDFGETFLSFLINAYTNPGYYRNLWIDLAKNQIISTQLKRQIPVITDLRSFAEWKMVASLKDTEIFAYYLHNPMAITRESDVNISAIAGLSRGVSKKFLNLLNIPGQTLPSVLAQTVIEDLNHHA